MKPNTSLRLITVIFITSKNRSCTNHRAHKDAGSTNQITVKTDKMARVSRRYLRRLKKKVFVVNSLWSNDGSIRHITTRLKTITCRVHCEGISYIVNSQYTFKSNSKQVTQFVNRFAKLYINRLPILLLPYTKFLHVYLIPILLEIRWYSHWRFDYNQVDPNP